MSAQSLNVLLRALNLSAFVLHYQDAAQTAQSQGWEPLAYLHYSGRVGDRDPEAAEDRASAQGLAPSKRQDSEHVGYDEVSPEGATTITVVVLRAVSGAG